ncbi:MAG: type II secretion system protein [Sulfurospirillaceae bacterium]|nr:type II secretion system protein [Sulfurospirillaceae bacterium]
MRTNKYIKSAFTIVELVFVIILIGILTSIGVSFLPDNKLLNDTNFLVMKIKEKQRNAIGYDAVGFADPWSVEDNSTCVNFNTATLENEDKNSQKPYKFTSNLSVVNSTNSTICFDEFGRPYQSGSLLKNRIDVNISHNINKYNIISVEPMSGYVIIKN